MILLAGSLFTVTLVYYLAHSSTTVAISNGRVAVHTTAEYLLPLMIQTISVELLIVSLATIAMTLFISHKIAGPLYRLKISLEALGKGDLSKMHLRDGDQLQEVAVSYNEAMGNLNDKVETLKGASSMQEVKKILNTFKVL